MLVDTFREDGCRVCEGHALRNFSAFSQVRAGALASGCDLSQTQPSFPTKTANRIPQYRASLLDSSRKAIALHIIRRRAYVVLESLTL
jgi:hypothetical protein